MVYIIGNSKGFFEPPEDSISISEASNDKQQEEPLKGTAGAHPEEPVQESNSTGVNSSEAELSSSETTSSGDFLLDPLVLLCCENSLRLLSSKSLIQVLWSSPLSVFYHLLFAFALLSLFSNKFDIYDIFLQGSKKPIRKVKHSKSCYWTAILEKDNKFCGLLSLLQTGTFEIR